MDEAHEKEVQRADEDLRRQEFEAAFRHLERAHVPGRRMTGRHTDIHCRMLVADLRRSDLPEGVGQVARIAASVLFSGLWVLRGSSGILRVSAFGPMPALADPQKLVH